MSSSRTAAATSSADRALVAATGRIPARPSGRSRCRGSGTARAAAAPAQVPVDTAQAEFCAPPPEPAPAIGSRLAASPATHSPGTVVAQSGPATRTPPTPRTVPSPRRVTSKRSRNGSMPRRSNGIMKFGWTRRRRSRIATGMRSRRTRTGPSSRARARASTRPSAGGRSSSRPALSTYVPKRYDIERVIVEKAGAGV
ncbi:hypothetical protein Asp14428_07730 [Actinoplanes sp. NBRC 14428]|nr:hypothetical protein Asp14428_07730 [Actinoplanes sp. NBRC 14428]